MAPWPWFVVVGAALGMLTGFFGVGGSALATPLLSLLGVPPLLAVASPLPAAIPAAAVAAAPYVRAHQVRPRAAAWSVLGGLPATVAGALLSRVMGGPALLVASGAAMAIVGMRVVQNPASSDSARLAGEARRRNRPLLVAASAAVGLVTGLLANGGGFLLVPMYLLLFGLGMRESAGTSLLVVSVLSIPTLATHWALGHVDWTVAAAYALGAVPVSAVSGRLAQNVAGPTIRRAFGWFLIAAGAGFVAFRLAR